MNLQAYNLCGCFFVFLFFFFFLENPVEWHWRQIALTIRYVSLKVSISLFLSLSLYIYIYICILNKSWGQNPTRHQVYGHRPPITKTIQVRRTRHAGHGWKSKDEFISDVLLWTPAYGQANAGRPGQTYIQQLCEDTGCSPEDLPEAMNDREKWRERVRDIRAIGTTWWWWINYGNVWFSLFSLQLWVTSKGNPF